MSKGKPPMNGDFDETGAFAGSEDNLFEFEARRSVAASPSSTKEDWYHLMNGYKDAADFLVAHTAETRGDLRKLGNPIMFLYRHHLELALKDLIRDCRGLLRRDEIFPKTHRIDELWQVCCGLLHEISPGMSDNEEIQHTTRLLADFQKIDPMSVAFRYPEDKDRNPPVLGEAAFDLSTVRDVVGKISLLLECISEHVSTLEEHTF